MVGKFVIFTHSGKKLIGIIISEIKTKYTIRTFIDNKLVDITVPTNDLHIIDTDKININNAEL